MDQKNVTIRISAKLQNRQSMLQVVTVEYEVINRRNWIKIIRLVWESLRIRQWCRREASYYWQFVDQKADHIL